MFSCQLYGTQPHFLNDVNVYKCKMPCKTIETHDLYRLVLTRMLTWHRQ